MKSEVAKKESVDTGVVTFAIVMTLIFWAIFSFAGTFFINDSLVYIIAVIVYPISHMIVGSICGGIIESIFRFVDILFEFQEDKSWGSWERESKIGFAAIFPILFPPFLIIGILAVSIGIVFKMFS